MTTLAANRSYRLLFSATAVSNLGDGISALAFPWLATLLTRDPILISVVTASTYLPWLLFSIPAGLITDRGDRQKLIVHADLLRLGLTMAVVALILTIPAFPVNEGATGWIMVLSILSFLLGCAQVVRDNAAQTLLPSVVTGPQLERANGQLWSVEQIMGNFVGPPLAGVLIAMAVAVPFVTDAVTFALAALLVWMMVIPPRPLPPRAPLRQELQLAWRWMRDHPVILRLAIMLGLLNAAHMMATTVLVLVSQERLGLDAVGHGLLLTAGAAGGVAGGLLGPVLVDRIGRERCLRLVLWLMPLPFFAIAATGSVWVAGAALFFETFLGLVWNIITVSYRQRLIPDDLLGRVNSLYRFFGWGMMPAGALIGGLLVTVLEPSLGRSFALSGPYWTAGLATTALATYGLFRLRLRTVR